MKTPTDQLDNRDGTAVKPGAQLDHYRIENLVSQGRTTTTFRATDLQTNRQVALEVPRPEIEADPVLLQRFQREEEIDKTLDHPGLVKLIEKHGDAAGKAQSYLVREWFEGTSLRDLLLQGKLEPDRAVHIAVSICAVAEYVHSRGIVLRDLEPEHILVGAGDQVNLIHIGVSSKFGARRLTFTKLSQVVGSSQNASPEELLGKRANARSDIYSIGVMLYEMLTGQLPFPGPRMDERLTRYPIPPRELNPGISPQLQEVVYRAMEREPQNRYATAREFARDLTHLDEVGVADRPEFREWRKKPPSLSRKVLLYTAIALIPIVIFSLMLIFARR